LEIASCNKGISVAAEQTGAPCAVSSVLREELQLLWYLGEALAGRVS